MTTPSSGQISFSQIAQIVKANSSTTVSLGESDIRTLLGVGSGQISLSSAYSKPVAGSTSYSSPGSYTFIVPAYQYLATGVYGGGAGGQQGSSQETVCVCFFNWYCCGLGCTNNCAGNYGGAGGASSFNGVSASGGTSSAAGGGSGGTVTTGGANNGGAGGPGWSRGCTGSAGAAGYAGGLVTAGWTKAVNGPAYGASLAVTVGSGGAGGSGACGSGGTGSNGGSGIVNISWS